MCSSVASRGGSADCHSPRTRACRTANTCPRSHSARAWTPGGRPESGDRRPAPPRALPATIEEDARGTHAEAVRRYHSLGVECQQRAAAIAELERLLPTLEQTLAPLTEAVGRGLEAVGTIAREALVQRVSEVANQNIFALGLSGLVLQRTPMPQTLVSGASGLATHSASLG